MSAVNTRQIQGAKFFLTMLQGLSQAQGKKPVAQNPVFTTAKKPIGDSFTRTQPKISVGNNKKANLQGTAGTDFLGAVGNNRQDLQNGKAGNDYLTAIGNNMQEIFNGGAGNDFIGSIGNNHQDLAFGGAGNDLMMEMGNNHQDLMVGGSGNDALFAIGNNHQDFLSGGSGNDILAAVGNNHQDILNGGSGNDILGAVGDRHNSQLFGGDGNDKAYINASNSNIDAKQIEEIMLAGSQNDWQKYDEPAGGSKYFNAAKNTWVTVDANGKVVYEQPAPTPPPAHKPGHCGNDDVSYDFNFDWPSFDFQTPATDVGINDLDINNSYVNDSIIANISGNDNLIINYR